MPLSPEEQVVLKQLLEKAHPHVSPLMVNDGVICLLPLWLDTQFPMLEWVQSPWKLMGCS